MFGVVGSKYLWSSTLAATILLCASSEQPGYILTSTSVNVRPLTEVASRSPTWRIPNLPVHHAFWRDHKRFLAAGAYVHTSGSPSSASIPSMYVWQLLLIIVSGSSPCWVEVKEGGAAVSGVCHALKETKLDKVCGKKSQSIYFVEWSERPPNYSRHFVQQYVYIVSPLHKRLGCFLPGLRPLWAKELMHTLPKARGPPCLWGLLDMKNCDLVRSVVPTQESNVEFCRGFQ